MRGAHIYEAFVALAQNSLDNIFSGINIYLFKKFKFKRQDAGRRSGMNNGITIAQRIVNVVK